MILEGSGSGSKTTGNFPFYVILGRCEAVCGEPTSIHWAARQSFRVSLISRTRPNAGTSGIITVTRVGNPGNKRRQSILLLLWANVHPVGCWPVFSSSSLFLSQSERRHCRYNGDRRGKSRKGKTTISTIVAVSQRPASGLLANLFEFLSFPVPEETQTLQVTRGEIQERKDDN